MRRFRWILPVLLVTSLVGTAALAGCSGGSDERDAIRGTVEDFVTALDKRDEQKLYDLLSSESRNQTSAEDIAAGFASIEGLSFRLNSIDEDKIRLNESSDQASVDATVTVKLDDVEQEVPTTFLLQKEDGSWRFVPNPTPAETGEGGNQQPQPGPNAAQEEGGGTPEAAPSP